jgi:hypothetical protein
LFSASAELIFLVVTPCSFSQLQAFKLALLWGTVMSQSTRAEQKGGRSDGLAGGRGSKSCVVGRRNFLPMPEEIFFARNLAEEDFFAKKIWRRRFLREEGD